MLIDNHKKIYLKSGEVYIAKSPAIVWTVLGSCVSLILYSKKRKISAISHAQLPQPNLTSQPCRHTCPNPCFQAHEDISSEMRFVSCSTKYMLDELKKLGIAKNELTASIFGGSQMFAVRNELFAVGSRNVQQVRAILKSNKIPVIKEDVLGTQSRTLDYDTKEGIVSLKRGAK